MKRMIKVLGKLQELAVISNRITKLSVALTKREKTVVQCLDELGELLSKMDKCYQNGNGSGRNLDYEKSHKEVICQKAALILHVCLYAELDRKKKITNKMRLLISLISNEIHATSLEEMERKIRVLVW